MTINSVNTGFVFEPGQILIGQSPGNAAPNTLTAGTNVTITNGNGTITIGVNAPLIPITAETGTPIAMVTNNRYICNDGSGQVTFVLPTSGAIGDIVQIIGKSTAGYTITYTTNQQIVGLNRATTLSSGSLTSVQQYNSITLTCITTTTIWCITSMTGDFTIV